MTTATSNTAISNSAINNFAPLARLLWKEYRAIRGFWIALVVLVVLIQFITITFSQDARDSMGLIYNFALGAPAFFAIGCAGAAFAMEQEEGTFEFLRAGPATSNQVLISKLAIAFLATLAMFSLLLPIALWFMRGQLPDTPTLHGMLGLWLVAALEAIAWGTLFSLLTARPLLAICLAIATASTVAHLLAWTKASGPIADFSYAPYLQVVPYRLLVAGLVFAVDIALGLQWLHGPGQVQQRRKSKTPNNTTETKTAAADNSTPAVAAKPDRSAMLGHLLWQHWRQSWQMKLVLLGLVPISLAAEQMLATRDRDFLGPIPIAILASLAGSCVFLADQEKGRFRFFVEHNIPPRYVWFTRQISWLLYVALATFLFVWLSISAEEWQSWREAIRSMTNQWYRRDHHSNQPYFELAPILFAIGFSVVSYSAGQWTSMFIRSGLMAGVFGLLFSGVLCGWVFLTVYEMRLSFWWMVLPIPAVLLFATWLRAPDWVRENSRWSARLRVAAVLTIPAAVMLIAVPNIRVNQIPLIAPGFDPEAYLAEITPEALATGDLYRRAADTYIPYEERVENGQRILFPSGDTLNELDVGWLRNNSKTLDLLLEATEKPRCIVANPLSVNDAAELRHSGEMAVLMISSAREFELNGQLAEAMQRYFATLKMLAQWNNHSLPFTSNFNARHARAVFRRLRKWGAAPNQTRDQIAAAIKELEQLGENTMRWSDGVRSLYIVARRFLSGDESAAFIFMISRGSGRVELRGSRLWGKLMPWENERAMRMLNLLTSTALGRMDRINEIFAQQGRYNNKVEHYLDFYRSTESKLSNQGIDEVLPLWHRSVLDYFDVHYKDWHDFHSMQRAEWLATTNPNLSEIGGSGIEAAHHAVEFEAERRATIIILALKAFQLEHEKLPETLTELVGPYLKQLPLDPFSGRDFVYVREGLPSPDAMDTDAYTRRGIVVGEPGIWSTGPEVTISKWVQGDQQDEATGKSKPGVELEFHTLRHPAYHGHRLAPAEIWSKGRWFPIPVQKK
jgi:hypothetical protein